MIIKNNSRIFNICNEKFSFSSAFSKDLTYSKARLLHSRSGSTVASLC